MDFVGYSLSVIFVFVVFTSPLTVPLFIWLAIKESKKPRRYITQVGRKFEYKPQFRYYKKQIMTDREKSFYHRICFCIPDRYVIFPQIHLSSVLGVRSGQNFKSAFRHIHQKSVDFVVCDKITLAPVLAIELDDATHSQGDRILRDLEVNAIFADADFPLLRFQSIKITNEELKKIFQEKL